MIVFPYLFKYILVRSSDQFYVKKKSSQAIAAEDF